MIKLQDHPIASIFPLLPDDELKLLAKSIKEDGQEEKIVLFEDKILDGRNRYRACKLAGVEPETKQYRGKDPLAFVVRHNLRRMHMNESQRALVAAEISKLDPDSSTANLRSEGVRQSDAAVMLNVSERSVNSASRVLDAGDEKLIESVRAGEVSVAAAAAKVPKKERKPKPKAAAISAAKYETALVRIGHVCGKDVLAGIKKAIFSNITEKEAIFWAGLTDEQMADIQELVLVKRWKPTVAWKQVNKMVDGSTRITELTNLAIAAGGVWEGTIEGFDIVVTAPKSAKRQK